MEEIRQMVEEKVKLLFYDSTIFQKLCRRTSGYGKSSRELKNYASKIAQWLRKTFLDGSKLDQIRMETQGQRNCRPFAV